MLIYEENNSINEVLKWSISRNCINAIQ